MKVYFPLLSAAYEHMKMLLNVNKNAKIVVECELRVNVRFLALMNASSRYWSSIHANECVFSRNEQQKVYNQIFKENWARYLCSKELRIR